MRDNAISSRLGLVMCCTAMAGGCSTGVPGIPVNDTLRTMCPTLSDAAIASLITELTGQFGGTTASQSRDAIADRCVAATPDRFDAVTCTLCQEAVLLEIINDADAVEGMCPALDAAGQAALVDEFTTIMNDGGTLTDGHFEAGVRCLGENTDDRDASLCALCEGAVVLQVWGN